MFQILTINISIELFGLFFCLVCVSIAAFSPVGTGKIADTADDIRNLFICDAFVMFSDAMAGIFRGKFGTLPYLATNIGNFTLFLFNYVMFALMINLITHMIQSPYGRRFRIIAWAVVGLDFLILIWNLFSKKIYYINEDNLYIRGDWFPLSQLSGIICVIIGIFYIIQFRKLAKPREIVVFGVFGALCGAALLIQIVSYGIAWFNIAVLMGLVIIFVNNQMMLAESLQKQETELAEHKLMLEQSRMKLMMSQIKPHFIFNTLTSIAMLCDESPKVAKETTISFAKYLRGNMNSVEQVNPIPFEDELSHIKCYVQIELIRFGDYLNVEYDIKATDFEVPALSVQPLVENAIKHGVGQKAEGGTVILSSYETEDAYVITVRDDGVGFEKKELEKEKSLGVRNIKMRLEQMIGADLEMDSEVGKGTTATITIPKNTENMNNETEEEDK